MESIQDVKNPQVGKFYLVTCIEHTGIFPGHKFLPVIGPWHEDAEIVGFPDHHFHYDWRFMPTIAINKASPNHSHARPATRRLDHSDKLRSQDAFPILFRKMKMKRPMLEFPSHGWRGGEIDFVRKLEEHFQHDILKCRTCPHKGMPLDGMPVDEQGRVVCPGHGLRWNLKTGKLSPRLLNPDLD